LFAFPLYDYYIDVSTEKCEANGMDITLDFMTAKEASEKWGITIRRVQALCDRGQVPSAVKLGNMWVIPKNTPKPLDGRTKEAKQQKARV